MSNEDAWEKTATAAASLVVQHQADSATAADLVIVTDWVIVTDAPDKVMTVGPSGVRVKSLLSFRIALVGFEGNRQDAETRAWKPIVLKLATLTR